MMYRLIFCSALQKTQNETNKKSPSQPDGLFYLYRKLLHAVEQLRELALLVSSSILVDDTVLYSLVSLLDSSLVCERSLILIASLNCCEELLHSSTVQALEHLILKGLGSDNLNSLLRTLDNRQNIHLPT